MKVGEMWTFVGQVELQERNAVWAIFKHKGKKA
jgi:hypothetical protein